MPRTGKSAIEVWGGVECTVNRVGDRYSDQLERVGHSSRPEDLDRFAALGLRALRCPLLWERIAPRGLAAADWAWADEQMGRLRRLGVRPIVGLVHHGSGPPHTSLLDDSFVEGLREFAGAVARRYPWVQEFTPVNEPLTTARFSALYGLWYPHCRSTASFVRALLVQCRATAEAMRAIREVTPGARLVQTEDFGHTWGTPELRHQVVYENRRRLLSFDLLCGRVRPGHPLHDHLLEHGASESELAGFDGSDAPDVLGMNYYLTSDRFLDHRIERYPSVAAGGNGRDVYVDVEAVRVRRRGLAGQLPLLMQLHRRYGRPLAITEVHAGATREDQLRWFSESWRAAQRARARGADVRAVTAWALLGSWDWHTLLTREENVYESGVFEVHGATVRPTALARLVGDLAQGRPAGHPVLASPGWWHRAERLLYPPAGRTGASAPALRTRRVPSRPILITGASGTVGRAVALICAARGLEHRLLSRRQMDVADPASVAAALELHRPWAVVNAAGYVRVDDAEQDRERCFRENTTGPMVLAEACRSAGLLLLTYSSDLVFDGDKRGPYVESDGVGPLGVYGLSKARAEREVLASMPSALVVRTSALFGAWDESNFLTLGLRRLARGETLRAARDVVVSPTYVPDLVNASLDLLIDGEAGVWHVSNEGAVSWAEFARLAAAVAGFDPGPIEDCAAEDLGQIAARPRYSVLRTERGRPLPALDHSIERWWRASECTFAVAVTEAV